MAKESYDLAKLIKIHRLHQIAVRAELITLRQVALFAKGLQYTPIGFKTPMLYRFVRHPIYMGFVTAFWATPKMTLGHLVFAIATTGYILIAIQLEEKDLTAAYGSAYEQYREQTSMLVPLAKRRGMAVSGHSGRDGRPRRNNR